MVPTPLVILTASHELARSYQWPCGRWLAVCSWTGAPWRVKPKRGCALTLPPYGRRWMTAHVTPAMTATSSRAMIAAATPGTVCPLAHDQVVEGVRRRDGGGDPRGQGENRGALGADTRRQCARCHIGTTDHDVRLGKPRRGERDSRQGTHGDSAGAGDDRDNAALVVAGHGDRWRGPSIRVGDDRGRACHARPHGVLAD